MMGLAYLAQNTQKELLTEFFFVTNLWGVKQCNQNTADMIGKEFGADGYEISYHSNPRPSHADMAGKQFAIGKARTINGVHYPSFEDEAEALLEEYGCLHFKYSILLGVSEPAYSKEQLEEFKANDNRTFEFEGKEYTAYEAKQLMSRLESAAKAQKDLATLAKASGDDDLRREVQGKINLITSKYHQLSQASGLSTKMERMQSAGFRRVKAKNPAKTIDISGESGIIEMYRKKGTHRKITAEGKKIIDKPTYHKIIKPIIRQGADVRIANAEWLMRLEEANSTAVTIGDVIYFRPDATVSDVLEEVHHFLQNKKGLNSQYGHKQREILNEIEAKEYLLSVTDKYKIPEEETLVTKQHLEAYRRQMQEMIERGEWFE